MDGVVERQTLGQQRACPGDADRKVDSNRDGASEKMLDSWARKKKIFGGLRWN
jgi:hypothetical protein